MGLHKQYVLPQQPLTLTRFTDTDILTHVQGGPLQRSRRAWCCFRWLLSRIAWASRVVWALFTPSLKPTSWNRGSTSTRRGPTDSLNRRINCRTGTTPGESNIIHTSQTPRNTAIPTAGCALRIKGTTGRCHDATRMYVSQLFGQTWNMYVLFQDGAGGELVPGIGWSLRFFFNAFFFRASGETLIRGLFVWKPVTRWST